MPEHFLECPAEGDRTLRIDLVPILKAEARLREVAFVTGMKAPELLTALNAAWLRVSNTAVGVEYQLTRAKEAVAKRQAVVLLEVVPAYLESHKGVGSNPETRQALLTQDVELVRLRDRQEQVEAILKLLRIKAQGFENGFTAVKRILQTGIGMTGSGGTTLGDGPSASDRLGFDVEPGPTG